MNPLRFRDRPVLFTKPSLTGKDYRYSEHPLVPRFPHHGAWQRANVISARRSDRVARHVGFTLLGMMVVAFTVVLLR